MMICWDVHFPEVAQNLSYRGAEIIALPIWGGNPLLARARAVENQIFLVTSTYSSRQDWMKTGVIDPTGKWLALAKDWGDVVVVEVDLDKQYQIVEVDRALTEAAGQLIARHPLLAYDAIQLASALHIYPSFAQARRTSLTFLSADDRLLAIAQAERLASDNPNHHP